jgi:hypothetical protein
VDRGAAIVVEAEREREELRRRKPSNPEPRREWHRARRFGSPRLEAYEESRGPGGMRQRAKDPEQHVPADDALVRRPREEGGTSVTDSNEGGVMLTDEEDEIGRVEMDLHMGRAYRWSIASRMDGGVLDRELPLGPRHNRKHASAESRVAKWSARGSVNPARRALDRG